MMTRSIVLTILVIGSSLAAANTRNCAPAIPLESSEAADRCLVPDKEAFASLRDLRSGKYSDVEKGDKARTLAAKFPQNIYLQAMAAALNGDAGQVISQAEETRRRKEASQALASLLPKAGRQHPYLYDLIEREYLYHSELYEPLYLSGLRVKNEGKTRFGLGSIGIGASELAYQHFLANRMVEARSFAEKSTEAWLALVAGREADLIGNEYYTQALALQGSGDKAADLLEKSVAADEFRKVHAYWFDTYRQRLQKIRHVFQAEAWAQKLGKLEGFETLSAFVPRALQPSWEMKEEVYDACKKEFDELKGTALEFTYRSDGLKIFGVLSLPAAFDPAKKYPTIIYNHGGNRDFGGLTACAFKGFEAKYNAAGFLVIASQYRGVMGSEGQDEVGGKDVRDVLRLEELTTGLPFVDPERLVMVGGSRGSTMTYQALAGGSKVKAAVVIAGVSDYFKENQRRPDFEQQVLAEVVPNYWQNRDAELKARSAIFWSEKLNTPLLLIHGTNDWRVADYQSKDLYEKLKSLGKPVRLSIYSLAGHDFKKDGEAMGREVVEWLEKGYQEAGR